MSPERLKALKRDGAELIKNLKQQKARHDQQDRDRARAKKMVRGIAKNVLHGTAYFYADMSGYKPKSKKRARSLGDMF